MNPTLIKLLLALLWLVPGLGFLALDTISGQTHALPVGSLRLPFSWLFLLFAGLNFLRWWAARSARVERSPLSDRRVRRPRGHSDVEPNSAFRFDDPREPGTLNDEG